MTISSTVNRWSNTGDGSTTVFAYSNKIFASTDLKVYLDGVLQTSGYTVSGVGNIGGGNVTFSTAPASGVVVVIVREVPYTQPTNYPANGPFPSEATEIALDRQVVLAQQNSDALGRSLRLSETDTGSIGRLPTTAERANNLFRFDASGNPVAVAIADLSLAIDTLLSGLASGDMLYFDGTQWVNRTAGATLTALNAQPLDADLTTIAGLSPINGQVLTYSGGAWAPVTPVSASETDVRLLALQVAELSGDKLNMVDGIADSFEDETDVDTATSTNETYDASGDYYHNPGVAGVNTSGTPSSSYGGTVANANDNSDGTSWASGSLMNFAAASDAQKRVYKIDFGAEVDITEIVIDTISTSSGSGSWKVETSSDDSTYAIYGAAFTVTNTPASFTRTVSRTARYVAISYNGTGDYSGTSVTVRDLEIDTIGDPPNMTIVSDPFTADSVPDIGRIHVQADPQDAITINTDLTAEISRDGGSSWTAATLTLVGTLADGTVAYENSDVDISGQPSGTSMKYRIKTLNSKEVQIHGVILQWA